MFYVMKIGLNDNNVRLDWSFTININYRSFLFISVAHIK